MGKNEAPQVWKIQILHDVKKVLKKLPKNLLARIWKKINDLRNDRYPPGSVKLEGYDNLFRVRVGDWRIIYAIEEDRLVIVILEIGPRGEIYKDI